MFTTPPKEIADLRLPTPNTHKGQNGKLLIIGGSELFHAASAWSLHVAARMVDMVFYSSVTENNELVHEAKQHFWEGVVVPRKELLAYLEEADTILIGPGMTRKDPRPTISIAELRNLSKESIDWEHDTFTITNWLLAKFPHKKWVVDAGALQMVLPELLTETMIVTPHQGEFMRVFGESVNQQSVIQASVQHNSCVVVAKGHEDIVAQGSHSEMIKGGNEGMTKGGTGDVLAGLIAALYCTNSAWTSAVIGSYINKRAADTLYQTKGAFFSSTELADQVPLTLAEIVREMRGNTA